MAVVGRVAGWFPIDYNAPTWPRLIIWEGDQMIWDGQLGLWQKFQERGLGT